MSLHALRKGHSVRIGTAVFLIMQRLPEGGWQLQNTATGEWQTFVEDGLLDQFAAGQLSFVSASNQGTGPKMAYQKPSFATLLHTLAILSMWPGTASST